MWTDDPRRYGMFICVTPKPENAEGPSAQDGTWSGGFKAWKETDADFAVLIEAWNPKEKKSKRC